MNKKKYLFLLCMLAIAAGAYAQQAPFAGAPVNGQPQDITSQINYQYYDEGGQDVAYNDNATRQPDGASWRPTEMVDGGNANNIGYVQDGEWVEFTVDNVVPGWYTITISTTMPDGNTGRSTTFSWEDGDPFATMYPPETGGWGNMTETTSEEILIMTEGQKVLRATFLGGSCNYGWFRFDFLRANWGARVVSPANEETQVGFGDLELEWELDDGEVPGTVGTWNVYLSKNKQDVVDGNDLVLTPVDGAETTLLMSGIDHSSTYYWRVDAITTDANMSEGTVSEFDTVYMMPIIDLQPNTQVIGQGGCVATMTVEARSGELDIDNGADLIYTWYKDDAPYPGGSGQGVNSLEVTEGGEYFCLIENDFSGENPTESEHVFVVVQGHTGQILFNQDVGNAVSNPGSMINAGGQYTINASGSDIWDVADGMHFGYTPVKGDVEILARVVSISGGTNAWRKAGVMLRQDLSAESWNTAMLMAPFVVSNSIPSPVATWQVRPNGANPDNTNTSSQRDNSHTTPYWVRITRIGDVFTGYHSPDGITWTQEGSSWTLDMPETIFAGLAVTSHNTAELTTAVIDSVEINTLWSVQNPTYDPPANTDNWIDPDQNLALSWERSGVTPCSANYTVMLGTDPENMTPVGASDTAMSKVIDASLIDFDQTYYWQVLIDFGGESDAGPVWSFDTIKRLPVIRQDPIAVKVTDVGSSVEGITISASSLDAVPVTEYSWIRQSDSEVAYTGVPTVTGRTAEDDGNMYDCPLVLDGFQATQEGTYTCVVKNSAGEAQSTDVILLAARKMLHYKFDSAAPLVDSASGLNASLAGPDSSRMPKVTTADSIIALGDGAMEFIGVDDGNNDPNAGWLDTGLTATELGVSEALPRTVSVWAKTGSFNQAGLWDMGPTGTNSQNCSVRTYTSDNVWRVQHWGSADFDVTVDESLGNWVHFVYVYDGVTAMLYVNGELTGQEDVVLATKDSETLKIGMWRMDANTGNAMYVFDGLLDDFQLYNYAMGPFEAASLYTDGRPGESVCVVPITYDLDGDCIFNLSDIGIIAESWMDTNLVTP